MKRTTTTVLAMSLLGLAGCSSWQPMCPDYGQYRICPQGKMQNASTDTAASVAALQKERQGLADELAAARNENGALSDRVKSIEEQLANRDRELASLRSSAGDSTKLASQLSTAQSRLVVLQAGAGDKDKLAAELAAARERVADLEKQLGARDKELAGLRGDLSTEVAKLEEAQRGLVRALRPQIDKGNITVNLNNERLLINLASGYLFGSGEDRLSPSGAEALKRVGAILKDYPEKKVAVDGHTDNQPIRSALKNKFPTNMELSEARAANAAKALVEGGLSTVTTHGYADTRPVAPNKTDAGRGKNRRVEIIVS